jgi:hypothetical protein
MTGFKRTGKQGGDDKRIKNREEGYKGRVSIAVPAFAVLRGRGRARPLRNQH